MNKNRGPMPVAFFGIAVGALAMANAWRVAERIWSVPAAVEHLLTLAALAVWIAVLGGYAHKWLVHRDAAIAEMQHPVQSSFSALGPVSSLLAAQALIHYSRPLAFAVFVVAAASALAIGVYLHGRFWQGGRKAELTTPAIYLPSVGTSFVAGTTAAAFGWTQLGALFFGAGVLSWLALESMILHRASVLEPLPDALRPTLGIQLAPPVVGGVTYMSITNGTPDVFAMILLGYGLYQALLLLRLLPWIRKQAFAPSYWAFSFGVAALPTLAMRMVERGSTGLVVWLAPSLFIAANVVIGMLVVKTVALMLRGELLPAALAQAEPSGAREAADQRMNVPTPSSS
ncbi:MULTISPECIES: dicarboxylate transporter/tellurite-resistance protein TehA [unclassified Caballeronia]|uniref:dicarboxylate transporter/tellurite-resistance protein TehA n=1 Tax=unclassified Caballeronia TaxID=2646786 RepID=UPI00286407AB|nr:MULTISPECIES: dicarboxylate transporter/tellurite-resistance protein TehA [unclassified Caballeronia]MDR5754336.1 dicarboxylate transporter/tellurite-resistance protein TehA [Caballeronia sp. LZ024]MDR5840714.1 dicarboxylate transporter/tellurite-resistance protein TehA [Caballeronia sp. LZ031]